MKKTATKKTVTMTKAQIGHLYKQVAEGITTLYQMSEESQDMVADNPARTYFVALSGYLNERGVTEALAVYGHMIVDFVVGQQVGK